MAQSKDIMDWDLCPSTTANMGTNWWEFPLEDVLSVDVGVERLQFANVNSNFFPILTISIIFHSLAIYCPRLTVPKYGSVNYTISKYGSIKGYYGLGSVSKYSCKYGYKLVGISTRRCLISGRWGGKTPICKRNFIF